MAEESLVAWKNLIGFEHLGGQIIIQYNIWTITTYSKGCGYSL